MSMAEEDVSPETLDDIRMLVKENGLTVVTTARFLPCDQKTLFFPDQGDERRKRAVDCRKKLQGCMA